MEDLVVHTLYRRDCGKLEMQLEAIGGRRHGGRAERMCADLLIVQQVPL